MISVRNGGSTEGGNVAPDTYNGKPTGAPGAAIGDVRRDDPRAPGISQRFGQFWRTLNENAAAVGEKADRRFKGLLRLHGGAINPAKPPDAAAADAGTVAADAGTVAADAGAKAFPAPSASAGKARRGSTTVDTELQQMHTPASVLAARYKGVEGAFDPPRYMMLGAAVNPYRDPSPGHGAAGAASAGNARPELQASGRTMAGKPAAERRQSPKVAAQRNPAPGLRLHEQRKPRRLPRPHDVLQILRDWLQSLIDKLARPPARAASPRMAMLDRALVSALHVTGIGAMAAGGGGLLAASQSLLVADAVLALAVGTVLVALAALRLWVRTREDDSRAEDGLGQGSAALGQAEG